MNWRRIWIGLATGLALILIVRWAPLLTPLIIGIVIGFIVRKSLRGVIVSAAAGILGNAITLLVFPNLLSQTIQAIPQYNYLILSNPWLVVIVTTVVMIIGGAIGGAISAAGLQLTYQKGVKKGEEVEKIKVTMNQKMTPRKTRSRRS